MTDWEEKAFGPLCGDWGEAKARLEGRIESLVRGKDYGLVADIRAALAEVERLREALGRVLTEAGLQAHKHGCANKIARPAQWDARLPCAGCQAESALQGR